MLFLTILNTVLLIVLLIKTEIIKVSVYRDETFDNNTIVGYYVQISKFQFKIPLRNKQKTEVRERVHRMLTKYSPQHTTQELRAMFSWLNTWDEVKQFKKDYSIVDEELVQQLVDDFVPKKRWGE